MSPGEAIRAGLAEAKRLPWTWSVRAQRWTRSDGAACYEDAERGGWWALGPIGWPLVKDTTPEAAMAAVDARWV